MAKLSYRKRQLLGMAINAKQEGPGATPIWDFGHKNTARALEREGLVKIERTSETFGGAREWRLTVTPAGEQAYAVSS